jgi:hypothetical protein
VTPFAALGLPETGGLTDAQVRAAWRDIAAAAHPDRADGGDPAAYAAAAAAYAQLRTAWGRTEALADLAAHATAMPAAGTRHPAPATGRILARTAWQSAARLPARVRHGRPGRLAARSLIAAGGALLAVTVIPGTPSAPAVAAGCALWWALTMRGDLAPPPGR